MGHAFNVALPFLMLMGGVGTLVFSVLMVASAIRRTRRERREQPVVRR
jgi:hypothetical protein